MFTIKALEQSLIQHAYATCPRLLTNTEGLTVCCVTEGVRKKGISFVGLKKKGLSHVSSVEISKS